MNRQRKEKGRQTMGRSNGFTIIEVVLVLAIAGLIFLMVFIALPALQRGQRDAQRKSDISRMMTQIVSYSTNNRGDIPKAESFYATTTGFITKYLGGAVPVGTATTGDPKVTGPEYLDPSTGVGYTAVTSDLSLLSSAVTGNIYYAPNNICGIDGALSSGAGARKFALQMKLEGQGTPYCVDNR